MTGLALWQEIERALVAGEPLPEDVRTRLSELAQMIVLLADDPRVPPKRAAAEAAKLAGFSGKDFEAHRLALRERVYGEAYEIDWRLRAQTGTGFTRETKAEAAADKLAEMAGVKNRRTIWRWHAKLPESVRLLFADRIK